MAKVNLTPLKKYLPEAALPLLEPLLSGYALDLRIVQPRKTKFGDYRLPRNGQRHRISLNANLNCYAFLITLLHEFAHLVAFDKYGRQIKAHGSEWQNTFREISAPFLGKEIFPDKLEACFIDSLNRGHASSATSSALLRELKKFDHHQEALTFVEDLQNGSRFQIGKKVFVKGPKSRKRYKCRSVSDNRYYMVHPLAEVQIINTN